MDTPKTLEPWKQPAVPRHVIQMLVIDPNEKLLLMHRSDKVRSARNVWSIPSGEHEIGETIKSCAFRELEEEYGLIGQNCVLADQYENIAGDEAPPHYHWVISLYYVIVADVTQAINKEPEKHDVMKFVDIFSMSNKFFDEHPFHPSLHNLIRDSILYWYSEYRK